MPQEIKTLKRNMYTVKRNQVYKLSNNINTIFIHFIRLSNISYMTINSTHRYCKGRNIMYCCNSLVTLDENRRAVKLCTQSMTTSFYNLK